MKLRYVCFLGAVIAVQAQASYRCVELGQEELDRTLKRYYAGADVVADLGREASGISNLYTVKRVWKGVVGRETYLTITEPQLSASMPVTIVFARYHPYEGPLQRINAPPCYLGYGELVANMNRLFGPGSRPTKKNTVSQLSYFHSAWYAFVIFLSLASAALVLQNLTSWFSKRNYRGH